MTDFFKIFSLQEQSVFPLSSPLQPTAGIAGGEMASPALTVQTQHAQALNISRLGYYILKTHELMGRRCLRVFGCRYPIPSGALDVPQPPGASLHHRLRPFPHQRSEII